MQFCHRSYLCIYMCVQIYLCIQYIYYIGTAPSLVSSSLQSCSIFRRNGKPKTTNGASFLVSFIHISVSSSCEGWDLSSLIFKFVEGMHPKLCDINTCPLVPMTQWYIRVITCLDREDATDCSCLVCAGSARISWTRPFTDFYAGMGSGQ